MKGRKRKSAEERKLSGNAGKRSMADEVVPTQIIEQDVSVSEDDPPADLPEGAKAKWREFMPSLRNLGLLRETDYQTLRMLCVECWFYDQAIASLQDCGGKMVYETDTKHGKMLRTRPEKSIMDRSARTIRSLLAELGMTSSSRIRTLATGVSSKQMSLPFAKPNSPTVQAPSEKPDDIVGMLSRALN